MSNFKRKTTNGYESIPINADMLGGMTLEQIQDLISDKQDILKFLAMVDEQLSIDNCGFVNISLSKSQRPGTHGNYYTVVNAKGYTADGIVKEAGAAAKATSDSYGLIKIGYSESNKNYAVKLDADGKAYVNVPWTSSGYTLPDATSGTKGGVKAVFGAQSGGEGNFELYADIQQSNNTLYIRAGQFKQTSGSASSTTRFTFKRAMSTMGGRASSVAVILGDSYGQSTSGGYMGSLAVDGSDAEGFKYRASNGELGHVYYIAIGRW